MAVTLVASAYLDQSSAPSGSLTVPAGVTADHLAVFVSATPNSGTTTFTLPGWTKRVENPTGQSNSEWTLATRRGLVAGDTISWTMTTARLVHVVVVFLDTAGQDVALVGTTGVRNGTSGAATVIPGITTTRANQPVLVVASERTLATGTVVSSWAPSAPSTLFFREGAADSSTFVGVFEQATAGATGNRTATYNATSGNATGVMLAIDPAPEVKAASTSGSLPSMTRLQGALTKTEDAPPSGGTVPSTGDRGGPPSTVPMLVGRDYAAQLSGSAQGSFPAPTGTVGFLRRGQIVSWVAGNLPVPTSVATSSAQQTTRPAGSLPAPTATFTTTSVVLPEFHVTGSGRLVDATAGPQSVVIGRRRAGVGGLPVLTGSASLVTNRFASASGRLPSLIEHEVPVRRTFRAFQTPAYREQFEFPRTRLPGYFLQAMSVWRLAGVWDYGPVTDPALIGDPEVFLRGGHIHYLSPTDEAELTAAGLGDHFYDEVRR